MPQTKYDQLPEELQAKVKQHFEKLTKEKLLEQVLRRLSNSDILKAITEGSK